MNYLVITYSIYLALTIGLTIWVARTLLTSSKAFLLDIFHREQQLSDAVARLLDVGFYLVSFGCAFLMLKVHTNRYYDSETSTWITETVASAQDLIETLSQKTGAFVLILGILLFLNLLILLALRKGKNEQGAASSVQVKA